MSDTHSTTSCSPLYMVHGRGAYQDLIGAALAGEVPPHAIVPPMGPLRMLSTWPGLSEHMSRDSGCLSRSAASVDGIHVWNMPLCKTLHTLSSAITSTPHVELSFNALAACHLNCQTLP